MPQEREIVRAREACGSGADNRNDFPRARRSTCGLDRAPHGPRDGSRFEP
jgi:hypothetical protein